MPRKLRIEYPGAIYHVVNRGDHREEIFREKRDYELFLETLGQVCLRTGWQVHAYCLMQNHFHLVVETPRANLVAGMTWFLGTYTSRFNRRHKLHGHLFSGRYKASIVDGSGNGYLRTVCEYVHLNAVRAKILQPRQPLHAYPWSSWPDYLRPPYKRKGWLRVDRVFGEGGFNHDNARTRALLAGALEHRRLSEQQLEDPRWKSLRRSWCWGPDTFRDELLEEIELRRGAHHSGEELQESDEQKARRLVASMLAQGGWTREELKRHKKGDVRKVRMAARLRSETTMTWPWIAQHLEMGSWRTARNAFRRMTQPHPK